MTSPRTRAATPQALRVLGLLLAWVALQPGAAWAQTTGCGTNGTSTLVLRATAPVPTGTYTSSSTEGDKHPGANPGPETIRATSFTYSNYASTAPGATTVFTANDRFSLSPAGTSGNIDGRALIWRQVHSGQNLTASSGTTNGVPAGSYVNTDNNNGTPFYSTVTLTFNREVSNLQFVVQDLDKGTYTYGGNGTVGNNNVGGSDFTDDLGLYALNAAGTRVPLLAANVTTVANVNTFDANKTINGVQQDAVRGIGLNGTTNGSSRAGNVTIRFASPVKSVQLTFRNLNTVPQGDVRIQSIAFEQISWCAQADLTTTIAPVATPVVAGTTGQFNVTFSNAGDFATGATTQTVQLPTGLTNVSATTPTGITANYVSGTGLLTYTINTGTAAAANQPANYQGTFSSVISFTAPATGPVGATASITSGTTEGPAADQNANTATASIAVTPLVLSGNIFEDRNYGGGLGRSIATANAVTAGSATNVGTAGTPATAATVELYNATTGAFVASTTTSTTAGTVGQYSFGAGLIAPGTSYVVRVVNSTVRSTRPGSIAGLLPVQTYNNGTNRVGGQYPARADAAANTTSANLSTLTPTSGGTAAQSLATVAVGTANVTGVDFGFNFSTIVNTNDTGQGSLRQFILNSNTLTNTAANLDQAPASSGGPDPAAGVETSIFMISDGSADAGLTAYNATTNPGLISQLSGAVGGVGGTVAIITPNTATNGALPSITDANTSINGNTQFQNIGNNNNVTLGTGGTVGVNATALGQLDGPEVQIVGTPGTTNSEFGLDVRANSTNISGIAIYGFGNTQNNTGGGNIRVTSTLANAALTGVTITGNVIGTSASSFTDPGSTATRSTGNGILLTVGGAPAASPFSVAITNNLIGYNGTGGVESLVSGTGDGITTGIIISGNEVRGNAILGNVSDGVRLGYLGGYIRNNLFDSNRGPGIDITGTTATLGNSVITNNTINNNGLFGTGQTPGIRVDGASHSITQNIISNNYGAGVLVRSGATATTISQNSIFGNGALDPDGAGPIVASGQVGIDLQGTADNNGTGTAPYVTLNSATTTGGNGLLNYPVLTSATVVGTNLVVTGFAKANARIELFAAQVNNLSSPSATTGNNFGQGQTYLGFVTENGTATGGALAADTNPATGQTYGPGNINGFAQGTDTNASAFTYTIPLSSLPGGFAPGTVLTSTATLSNATSEFSGNVTVGNVLSGYVFEDVNYGGGAGRPRTATGASVRQNARVELYDASGTFVAATTTNASGLYTFNAIPGNYTVRVVNSTVTSSRTGYTSALVPVQTYNGTATRVGGEAPEKVDAGNGTTGTTLASLNTGTTIAASQGTVTVGTGTSTTGPDFGFNFDLVVNTNDAGQGSLRQFILNSNALGGEGSLAQSGNTRAATSAAATTALPANVESSIFMIPNGQANAGQLAGLVNQFTTTTGANTAASIRVTSADLPAITGANTSLDGGTQTATTGNTNAYSLATTNAETTGPEVIIDLGYRSATPGPAATGFGAVRVNANDVRLLNLGVANGASNAEGILIQNNALRTIITNNTVNDNDANIAFDGSGTANASTITYNVIRNSRGANNDGIELNGGNNNLTIEYNQILRNAGNGIDFINGANTGVTIRYNNISGNGTAGGGQSQLSGVALRNTGSNNNVVSFNTFNNNSGSGIIVVGGSTGNVFSQNSFYANGINTTDTGAAYTAPAGRGLAIDLTATTDKNTGANGDGVTLNDLNDADSGGNNLLNFPIITSATVVGTNLVVQGYARPGALIELYNPGPTADPTGFGEGQTYLGTVTEGGAAGGGNLVADTDATTGTYGPGTINGRTQGTDNTNRFIFTIPLTGNFAAYAAGSVLSSTATLGGETSEFSGNVVVNSTPVPNTLTNANVPNTNGATVLNPNLSATVSGVGNSVQYYTITGLPTSGTLIYNGTTLTAGNIATTQITPALLNTLTYTPVSGFVGTPSFTYTVTDANNITSNSNNNAGSITAGAATYTIPVIAVADVATTITPSVTPVNAGAALSFNVTFTNAGPNPAAGYAQTLTLTAGLGTVNFPTLPSGVTASYNNGNGVVTFTGSPATLASGGNQNLTVTIPNVPAALASVTASTTVTTTTSQGADTGANSASVTVPVTPVANVATTISASPTPVNAGGTLTIPVTFTNGGPSTADNVTRSVQLQAGLGTGNVTATNGGVYDNATGLVNYPSTLTLANGANLNSTITITAVPASFATITAVSTIGTTTSENGATANNVATLTTVNVTPVADVYTNLTGPASLTAGLQSGNYSVTFGNNGPSTAAGVNRTVSVPANTATAVTSSAGGTVTGNFLSGWTITYATAGSFATGTSNNYTFTITPGQLTTGTAIAVTSNTSTTTSQNGATGNDASTVTLTPGAVADVTTTLTAPASLLTGVASGNYTVVFANNGPSPAAGVTRVVTIPANTASAVSAPGATVTGNQASGWTLTYPGGTIASGNSDSYTFTLTPAAAASGTNLVVTSTTGTTTPQGLNLGPDVATTTTAVTPVADVLTTITGPTTISQGQATGNYTATFTNSGPSTADAVTRTVTLPTGATLSPAQVTALNTTYGLTGNGLNTGSYSTTGSGATAVTTINFGNQATVASGASSSFVFAFTAPATSGAATIASNTGTTTSQNGATGNDVSTLNLTVSPVADVTTTLSGPTQLSTGQPTGPYTVTYANVGTAPASTVTRTVTLPAGATLTGTQTTAITSQGGTVSGTSINFGNVGTLAAGASANFTFSFTAPTTAGAVTVVSNTSTTTPEGTNPAPNSSTINTTVNAVADVAATITPIAASVAAGATGTGFNVSFSNLGALTPAAGVTYTVQLPAGLGTVSATNGGTYNNTTGLVTYTPSPTTIAAGTPLTSQITFTAPTTGPVTATANVATTSNEAGQTANNTQSASIAITPRFDLTTTIYGPGTVLQGNQVTLNVTTTNNGPSATTATQTVQLIAGLTNVFVSNGGTYNSANGLVSFPAIASLPSGQTVANTISFTAPTAGTALAPAATVTPNTAPAGESNIANNTAYLNGAATSTNITINAPTALLANVYTTVSATPQSVAAGSPVTVTVTQGNAGPTAASNVVETVQLLPGLTLTTTPSGATYNSTTGLLTLPTIGSQASGASTSYTVVFTAPANAGNNGQLLIGASVTTQTSETVLADNVASTVVTVVPTADVATAVSGPANASAGQQVTYTASFANNGQGTATSVTRTVQLPTGLGTVTILDVATGLAAGTYNSTTGLVTFTTLATQAAGTSSAYTLNFAASASNFTVRSATGATTVDGVTTNNTSSVSTTVANAADVTVAITGPASAVVGNPVTYFVTTTNNGPSGATGVATTLQLPTGLTGVTVSNGGTYVSGTGLVTFTAIGALNSGASVGDYVTFTMPNAPGGQLAGVATTTSTSTDPISANNSASTATSVAPVTGPIADVATTVSAAGSIAAGATLTVTATFTNNGPAAALNVAPTAQLPAGLAGVVVSNSGTYNPATGVVTWPLIASQASGNTATYTVAFTAPATGPVRATTAVSSQTSDNVPGNNSNSTTTTITTAYDAVTSLSGPASSLPGVTNTYTVTATNNGPSAAPSVQQTVTLPAGVTATNISNGGTQTGTTITWPALTNLAPGATNAVSYTFDVTMPATGNLAVNASVSTGTGETNAGNNDATTLTTTRANQPPVASNVVNSLQSPEGNTAGQLLISPLAATDADGTIFSYQLTSIPNATTQGVLYYNNGGTYTALTTANIVGGGTVVNLTSTQAGTLRFDPVSTFTGNVFFNYTATDNGGAISNVALYTIPVSNDIPALYTVAPVKGGTTNPYNNGDVLATVFDPNGGTYTSGGAVNFNGLASAVLTTGPLPAGTALDPITGQIAVTDRSLLVPGSYPLTITTTDVFGGVTVHNITITIGGSPIAVDDFATTNLNTAIIFAVSGNDLANGGAAINANTIDLDPFTAGIQNTITTAQGTFQTNAADNTIPVGSVRFTPASPTFTGTATTPYTINNSATPAATSNQANLGVTVRSPLPVDLSTTITAATNPVNAGASETLTVTVTNNSTTTASANTMLTVQLPAGLTTTGFTVSGSPGTLAGTTITFPVGTYNQTTGLLTYTSASLAAGATTSSNIIFPAPAASFTATSQVGNGTTDPTPGNNVASVNVTVTPQFDLTTSLTGPASVVSGDLATYTVVSRNNGPSAVANAVQTVQLPTGLTGVFITGGGYYNATAGSQTLYFVNGLFTTTNPGGSPTSYPLAAGGVIFPPANLSSGQAIANSISFAPTADFSPSALITPNTTPAGETNIGNNTGYLNGAGTLTVVTVTGATTNQANVYVTVAGPATVTPGASATYTVTQGNNGPNSAASVITTVSLPTGLTTATLTIGGVTGTLSGNVITFGTGGPQYNVLTGIVTFPTLGTQASAATPQSYSIVLTAPASGTYNVTGNVLTSTSDPVPGDNVASVMTTIAPSADVATTITGPASATAGQPVSYTVTSTNTSGVPATGVVQTVSLPAGLAATDLRVGGSLGTLSTGVITFPNGATYSTTSGLLTLATIASLPANGTQTTAIVFTAPGTTGSLSLTANSTTTSYDGVPANNRSTVTTTLTANADVAVAIAGPATVTTGNPATYTVTTTNNGPSVAGSETTTVQLPTGLPISGPNVVRINGQTPTSTSGTIISYADGSSYNAATGLVTLPTVTNLLPGQGNAVTATITFLAPDTPRLDVAAIASVPGTNGDPNLDNNQATAVTTVTPASATPADVAVTLVPNLTTQTAGSPVVYTLTTQNNTTANPAANVTRTVSLPAGLTSTTLTLNGTTGTSTTNGIITFAGGPNNGATYNTATGVLTLPTIASLVNGTPVVTTITVTPANGPLLASATVAGANTDPNTANNAAQATSVTITPSNDVATYLTAPASAAVGSTVTYTVVTANNGPSNVASITQTVVLPTGATGITAPVGASVSGTTVTYTVSSLTAGSSQTNAISFVMPNVASAAGTASVPTTNDAAPANNTASATTTRPNQAPVAQDVVNTLQSPEGNTANAPLPVSPLSAADADGTVASYTVLTLPTAAQGVLYVWNGTANVELNLTNFPGLVLTPTQAQNLRFDPASTFAGTVNFTYQATDNLGAISNPGRYTIQSGIDNASVYVNTPVKTNTNTNPYVTNDVISFVVDPNGAAYNSSAQVYNPSTGALQGGTNNGLTNAVLAPSGSGPASNPTNVLPSGISLNPATGQIFVSNAAALPAITTNTSYSVNITTTDVYGGVTTQTVTFTLGAYPLPVELTVFTAKAVQLDGVLRWTTASEKNNDHFDVERSLDGRTFTKIGEVQGQGSKASPTTYSLTDASIGARVSGPVYYRLKQVDVDGASSYSPVRTIAFTKPTTPTMSLYPNPATSATELDLTQVPTGTYTVSILDATGRVLVGLHLEAGLTHKVNLTEVASGTYTVLLRGTTADGATLNLTKRLIKD